MSVSDLVNFVTRSSSWFPTETQAVINLPLANAAAQLSHEPTVLRTIYDLTLSARVGCSLAVSVRNPVALATQLFLLTAMPVARLTGSSTVNHAARVTVDVVGTVAYAEKWIAARVLHFGASSLSDLVPNSSTWIARAAKDVAEITAHECASFAAATLSRTSIQSTPAAPPKGDLNLLKAVENLNGQIHPWTRGPEFL